MPGPLQRDPGAPGWLGPTPLSPKEQWRLRPTNGYPMTARLARMRADPFHRDVGEGPRLGPERRAAPLPPSSLGSLRGGGQGRGGWEGRTAPGGETDGHPGEFPGGSSPCTAAPAGTRGRARRSMTRLAPQRYVDPDSGSRAAATARALHPGRRARTSSDSGSAPCRSRTRASPPRSAEQPCCRGRGSALGIGLGSGRPHLDAYAARGTCHAGGPPYKCGPR
jgi:hypothetical protein